MKTRRMTNQGAHQKSPRRRDWPAGFRSSARTHAGAARATNEDAFFSRNEMGLWAVADGMGGHASGDVASRMLTEGMAAIGGEFGFGNLGEDVKKNIQETHEAMAQRASNHAAAKAMGSTIAVLLGGRDSIECIWAGDSRIYRHREGRMTRLTRDHSLVQEMVDSGALDENAARKHPQKNVITRAVGAEKNLLLDSRTCSLSDGDKFLLCTDGLYEMLSDDEICTLISSGPINESADLLLATALARGAGDNVTFVLVESITEDKTPNNES